MRAKLDDGKIKYIIREREKGTSSAAIAEHGRQRTLRATPLS